MATLPNQVKAEMAKKEHRVSHLLWHGIRNTWERLNLSQKNAIRAIDPQWEPPRPAFDNLRRINRDNNSGEDFLFMHREMIKVTNAILKEAQDPAYPKVTGWKQLPEPDDADFPIVPVPLVGFERVKSNEYLTKTLKPWEQQYKSEAYLKSVTLGQLGSDLETTIHNNMHRRWCTPSAVGYRNNTPITQPVDVKWDDIQYDFLGDTYASHVNATFWKIHGWVDDRIEDWKKANNIDSINWTGTWVGPMHHDHGHHHFATEAKVFNNIKKENHFDKMMDAAKVIGEVKFSGFIIE